jgi:hypothetical protein
MRLLRWLPGTRPESRRAQEWRSACAGAIGLPDKTILDRLRADLESWGSADDDIEVEREMLDGLGDLVALAHSVSGGALPAVETGHRVVGSEVCHLSATCSMPDEAGQPGGRMLLTERRAIFVGGARGVTVAWHAVAEAMLADRDVLLIRADREHLYRFRCNSYSDAFRGTFIARQLIARQARARRSS